MTILTEIRSCIQRPLSIVVGVLVAMAARPVSAQPINDESDAFGRINTTTDAPRRIDFERIRTLGSVVERWNAIAIDATGLDHTPVAEGEARVFGEQLGPARSARAEAIIHIAMFEAVNAIDGQYASYIGLAPVKKPNKISARAALAQAAHDTLVKLFPSQARSFDDELAHELSGINDNSAKAHGVTLGKRAAKAILALRSNDGSNHMEPLIGTEYIPGNGPGIWRQDPVSRIPIALGALWKNVTPFVIQSASQFRAPVPPALSSAAYAAAYNEVKALGGDGLPGGTPTQRTEEQSFIGVYWAYDGTPSLCAPPRLYNQVTLTIAKQKGTKGLQLARLLALVNVGMADAALAAWDSKYFYQLWRPVTGIREADPGTGPTGAGDNNPGTTGDVNFTPFGAPASNLGGPDFTPPFPAYPSGHATFGGLLFEVLRNYYGTDTIPFTFVSDEWNGETRDSDGNIRPKRPRSFNTLSQAEEENGQSRIYLGIHWSYDKTEGITQGRRVADYVQSRLYVRSIGNAQGGTEIDALSTDK